MSGENGPNVPEEDDGVFWFSLNCTAGPKPYSEPDVDAAAEEIKLERGRPESEMQRLWRMKLTKANKMDPVAVVIPERR